MGKRKLIKALKKEIKELEQGNYDLHVTIDIMKTQTDDLNIWSYELRISGNGAFEEVEL